MPETLEIRPGATTAAHGGAPPWWLPRGSLRFVLAASVLGVALAMALDGTDVPEWLVGLAVLAFRDYFSTRASTQATPAPGGEG